VRMPRYELAPVTIARIENSKIYGNSLLSGNFVDGAGQVTGRE
jgi:hypothetical protein